MVFMILYELSDYIIYYLNGDVLKEGVIIN